MDSVAVFYYTMEWRTRAYKNYHKYMTVVRAVPSLEFYRSQFSSWSAYYGSHLSKDKDAAILDVGCGSGGIVWWLKERGYKNAYGIDSNADAVSDAHHLGIEEVEEADCIAFLSDKHAAYDCIFARDFIEHFTKEEVFPIFDTLFAALKPGGVFVFQTPNMESPFGSRARYYDFTHCVGYTWSSISHALVTADFSDVRCYAMKPVPHGIISLTRCMLWWCIECALRAYLLIETGSGKGIFTQNMIICCTKKRIENKRI